MFEGMAAPQQRHQRLMLAKASLMRIGACGRAYIASM
jgi:hypothetical protein